MVVNAGVRMIIYRYRYIIELRQLIILQIMKTNSKQELQNNPDDSYLKTFFNAQIQIQEQKLKLQQENDQKLSLGKTVANLHNIYVDHSYKSKQKHKSMQKIRHYFRKYQPFHFNNVDMKKFHYNTRNVKLKNYKQANYYGQVNLQTGKKQGLGIMVYSNNKIYEGQWKNDQKSGRGYQKFANGSIYEGQYQNGKPNGIGKLVNNYLQLYQGEWKNGLKHGKGFWRGPKGDSYLGQWILGKAEGYGVHTWANGDKYEGQFKSCLKHGQGIQKFANGDIYKGTYENGKPSGFGEYFWANKSFFKGYFKNGLRSGHGLWKKKAGNSDKYQGEYQTDKKWGTGVFTWESGNIYKGNYNGDVRNGYGQMHWIDGSYYKGQWLNGVQNGKGQIFIPDLGYRRGLFQNNQIIQIQYEQLIQQSNQAEEQKNIQKSIQLGKDRLSSKQSQSKLSVISKNRLKTNSSKLQSIKQLKRKNGSQMEDNFAELQQQKYTKLNRQNSIRTKTQSFHIKTKNIGLKYQESKKNDFIFKQNSSAGQRKKVPINDIFNVDNTHSRNKNSVFFKYMTKQTQFGDKLKESLDKGKCVNRYTSIDFKNKKKDRLLHSSFYLHRFRNINQNKYQNNQQIQAQNRKIKNNSLNQRQIIKVQGDVLI